MRWRVDEKLSYYPSTKLVEKMRELVDYLATQGEPIQLHKSRKREDGSVEEITNIRKQFGVSLIWIERMDKLRMIRLTSRYISVLRRAGLQPLRFFISLWDEKQIKKYLKKPVKKPEKLVYSEDILINRIKNKTSEISDDDDELSETT